MHTIDQVVGGHQGLWLALLNGILEAPQIYFTECPLAYHAVYAHTVIFLVVARKMLNRSSFSWNGLHASGDGSCQPSAYQWILRKILKVTATQWVPVDIHARRQPQGHLELFHLFSGRQSHLISQLCIPGHRHHRTDRECRTILIVNLFSLCQHFLWCKQTVFNTIYDIYRLYLTIGVRIIFLCQTDTRRTIC